MTHGMMAYLTIGVVVFTFLAFGIESERPQEGWWREWSFLGAGLVVVCFWPMVLVAWVWKGMN